MIYLRKANERGNVNLGWLTSRHSFSFGHYYDPKHMGFSALRVINDDVVSPGRGFETHGHRDMEIVSYVVSGALKHKDSSGNEYVVPEGDIQVMSAGRGIMHSEFNASTEEDVNFLQIWIVPDRKGGEPSYAQKTFGRNDINAQAHGASDRLELLVSNDGRKGSLVIKQDASISRLNLPTDDTVAFQTKERSGYLHVVSGNALITVKSEQNSTALGKGDAVGIFDNDEITIRAQNQLIALWFELPAQRLI